MEYQTDSHHAEKLEWIVIWLIVVEVVLQAMEMSLDRLWPPA